MAKKTDHLVFGAVWRWVGTSGAVPMDVMIVSHTDQTHWIKEERRVLVLRDAIYGAAARYSQGQLAVFNGFADKRWQHINV